jgi:hypothetical protein
MMCKRSDTREAQVVQDDAADALIAACVCADSIGMSLRGVYATVAREPIPEKLTELLRGLR